MDQQWWNKSVQAQRCLRRCFQPQVHVQAGEWVLTTRLSLVEGFTRLILRALLEMLTWLIVQMLSVGQQPSANVRPITAIPSKILRQC